MAATSQVPLELYLHTVYEPDAEFVDGEIEERAVGEDSHSAWQDAIAYWFRMHARDWNIRVRPELRVQTGATRFRVPDVAILDASLPREPIAKHPPLAVFEVLSPEDTYKKLIRKRVFASNLKTGSWYGARSSTCRKKGFGFPWRR